MSAKAVAPPDAPLTRSGIERTNTMKKEYLTEYGKAVILVGFGLAVLTYVLLFAPDPVSQVQAVIGG
jgi:hypothetical protein